MAKKTKKLILASRKQNTAAERGRSIMSNRSEAIVLWRNKEWPISELLEFLAQKVKVLEKNQCKPRTRCLFKAEEYLDNKYIKENNDTSNL